MKYAEIEVDRDLLPSAFLLGLVEHRDGAWWITDKGVGVVRDYLRRERKKRRGKK